jgi:hypothetical protein
MTSRSRPADEGGMADLPDAPLAHATTANSAHA